MRLEVLVESLQINSNNIATLWTEEKVMQWTTLMGQLISLLSWGKLGPMNQFHNSQTLLSQILKIFPHQEVADQQIFKQMDKLGNKVLHNYKTEKITEYTFHQCHWHQLNKIDRESVKLTIQWHRTKFQVHLKEAVTWSPKSVKEVLEVLEPRKRHQVSRMVTGNSFSKVKEEVLLEVEIIL